MRRVKLMTFITLYIIAFVLDRRERGKNKRSDRWRRVGARFLLSTWKHYCEISWPFFFFCYLSVGICFRLVNEYNRSKIGYR